MSTLSKTAKSSLCVNEVVMWQQERSTFWPEQLCCIQALLKESMYRFKPVIPLVAVYNILQRKVAQILQKALKSFYFKVLSSVAQDSRLDSALKNSKLYSYKISSIYYLLSCLAFYSSMSFSSCNFSLSLTFFFNQGIHFIPWVGRKD